jgi:hypothetical protein
LWELPSEELFNGPVGILPLELLTDDAAPNLAALVRDMDKRVGQELGSGRQADIVRDACYLLLGLRYDKDTIAQLFAGLQHMLHQSSTYQAILDEGREEGRRQAKQEDLLKLGRKKFGFPASDKELALKAVTDINRLDQLLDTLDQARSWEEWLQS